MTKFPIQIGTKRIEDMLDAKPEELDLGAIEYNLKTMRRFSGASGALTVHQHRCLVRRLVEMDRDRTFADDSIGDRLGERCCQWAYHHDDHEGVIGDIVAPVKRAITSETDILQRIEDFLDAALCAAHGIPQPSEIVRGLVYRYDKAAETLEWVHALRRPIQPWSHPCPDNLMESGAFLIGWARAQ